MVVRLFCIYTSGTSSFLFQLTVNLYRPKSQKVCRIMWKTKHTECGFTFLCVARQKFALQRNEQGILLQRDLSSSLFVEPLQGDRSLQATICSYHTYIGHELNASVGKRCDLNSKGLYCILNIIVSNLPNL